MNSYASRIVTRFHDPQVIATVNGGKLGQYFTELKVNLNYFELLIRRDSELRNALQHKTLVVRDYRLQNIVRQLDVSLSLCPLARYFGERVLELMRMQVVLSIPVGKSQHIVSK